MQLLLGDCLEQMKTLPDNSVDLILCDPPYGTTACKWDAVIPFDKMWEQLNRIAKPDAAICLFGGTPFGAALIMSNPKMFRHEWIWQKSRPGNFVSAKYQPMRDHESILVFSKQKARYFPIKEERKGSGLARINSKFGERTITSNTSGLVAKQNVTTAGEALRYPSSIQAFNNIESGPRFHPTQKPVALLEYLIKTYSQTGDHVLDFTMGSGSTGVAAKRLGRTFTGIERDAKYFEIAKTRIDGATNG